MKNVTVVIMMTLLSFSLNAQFTKATLQATGLTCAMCSNAIDKALHKVSSVASVEADIKNSAFHIVFKKDAAVDIDALKDAVEDAGFSVGSLRLTGTFNELKIANDEHIKIGNENFHFLNVGNQVLNGETTIKILDKNFVTAKEFKKYNGATKMHCLQTGKTESCCVKEGMTEGERVYHVTI